MMSDISSSVPSSSSCTSTAIFNRKRKLNESEINKQQKDEKLLNESEVNKQQKDEKLKSNTTKAETSKQDIYHNLCYFQPVLYFIFIYQKYSIQVMHHFYDFVYDCQMVQKKLYQCVQRTL